MAELEKTTGQSFSPVENIPAGDATGQRSISEKDEKYLTFVLKGEEYGIGILKIKEIMV